MTESPRRRIVPVILSGGSGTRLWPLSRELRPKQFLALVGSDTLFQQTVDRTLSLTGEISAPLVVCNVDHRFLVAEQLLEKNMRAGAILLEPGARNTAPAIAAAAMVAMRLAAKRNDAAAPDDDPLLLVLPADHVLLDSGAFSRAVDAALPAAAAGRLVTFGVVPRSAETGYGYLLRGAEHGAWSELEKFVEKPDAETARRYCESGRYLWNSGMFLFGARAFLQELGAHEPAMVDACARAVGSGETDPDFMRLGAAFLECASKSVDYAVMEKTQRSAVVPLSAGWSDVGSWPALHEILAKDADGNVALGDAVIHGCRDTYVAAHGRLVAAIGLDGVIVVETADAVLVMARERAQDVKQVVDALKASGRMEGATTPKAS